MSRKLIGACVIAQSGGPTAVINSSVYGIIKKAMSVPEITGIYGAAYGIVGVINDELYDLSLEDRYELELLLNTPSSVLGSCRYKMADPESNDTDYENILCVLKRHNIRYFFYNGGNDSMDTCEKISRYLNQVGYECRVIGVPKSIDNDLNGTDHCPGFGSAAKYISTSIAEVYNDVQVYGTDVVTIAEIMGRNAGWLTASSSLARMIGCGPSLIYLPEVNFNMTQFIEDIKRTISERNGNCFVAVSEGIHYEDGSLVSSGITDVKDSFGHVFMGGLAPKLAQIVKEEIGVKVRGIEFSLLQRCGAHIASKTDIAESCLAGEYAVEAALSGESGKMVGFERKSISGRYECKPILVPLKDVANFEKKVPLEWISPSGNDVTDEFIEYAAPLILGEPERVFEDGLPRFARLKKIRI